MAKASRRRRPALPRAVRLDLESLADRCVPAVVTEFPLTTTLPAPLGVTAGPDGALWYTDPGSNRVGRITTGGAVTEYTLPTATSDPREITAAADGSLWFTLFGVDRIGRIDPATGAITEFPLTANAGPTDIVEGPDGNLWFTEAASDKIGRITPTGTVTEFAVPGAGSTPFGITAGPDGNLWFTQFGSDEVGRITPAGVVTEFVLPAGRGPLDIAPGPDGQLYFTENTADRVGRLDPAAGSAAAIQASIVEFVVPGAGSAPAGIAAGPDGNVWFTESGSDEVGRLTPAGVVTEFSTGITAGGTPTGIVAGPDDNLWFTEPNAASLGRITTAGAVTEFALRASSGPGDLVTGPDGKLWFTESDADKVGRFDPATNALVEYSLPNTTSDPRGITAGPDGNIWFTEFGGDRVGRITPAGVITEFALSPGAGPADIVTGADDNLWFTEAGADKIGQITPAGVVTEFDVPGVGSTPFGIALGSDSRVWFTQFGSDEIGAIDTGGVVAEFAVPGDDGGPLFIAAGPDGNLWFTQNTSSEIGRITTAGVVTEFATATADIAPIGIVAGPDGALWFTATDRIGRVTAAGIGPELTDGITPGGGLYGITTTAGGGLAFAAPGTGTLGQVTFSADLLVTKTSDADDVAPGATVTYTIIVSNAAGSDPVETAQVTDAFTGLTGVTWTAVFAGGATGTTSGSGAIDETVALPAGGSVTYTATGTVNPAATGTLTNDAAVASDVPDPTPDDRSATATVTLTPSADLRVTKTDGVATVTAGGTLTYTIVVTNAGPSRVGSAQVTDAFTGLTGVTWTAAFAGGATGTASGSGAIDQTVVLPPGGTVTYTATGTVPATATATLMNSATVSTTVADPTPGNNTAIDITTIAPPPAPDPLLVGFSQFAAGSDLGGLATLYNADKSVRFNVEPFPGFAGGVRVAAADFNGDGVADLVVGTGPGRATRVLVLDGKTQAQLFAVDPFEATFTGGVYVAAGDVNDDGVADLVITPDEGGGPRVRVFSGNGFVAVLDFFGIGDLNFRGGARAAVGDVNADGIGDLIVAAGFGGGPRVAAFNGKTLFDALPAVVGAQPPKLFNDFFAFEQTLRNGVYIAAGDVNGDGFADLIAGGGPGGGPRVTAFCATCLLNSGGGNLNQIANFFGGDPNNRGGIRVAVKDLDGDDRADLVVGSGAGVGSRVTGYLGATIPEAGTPPATFDFDAFPGFAGGVFVG